MLKVVNTKYVPREKQTIRGLDFHLLVYVIWIHFLVVINELLLNKKVLQIIL